MKSRSVTGRWNPFRWLGLLGAILGIGTPVQAAASPEPYGPTPSERQLRWHELEFYGMIHFGLNTFTDTEWGPGNVPASVFNHCWTSCERRPPRKQ